ncbi:MAG: hypothetical protein A2Y10_13360 [Planctomycetes bacterium GWF2_41_51]|nr:MAG: hypothetical protein A2Y10_13360 [Planctomycetes bacterium GWF2_41_51]HBG26278.1 hypothetical protein [Phycisphaerales bacterium]
MRFILDMIHNNPGEKPFETSFSSPGKLKAYGFNGQVFKHINCLATFAKIGNGAFPASDEEKSWYENLKAKVNIQIQNAKAAGLEVFYHIDLFVLPRSIVSTFRDDICDDDSGKITIEKELTLKLHEVLFDEICSVYPEIDGFIVRVGETYLMDTPYHVGNSPIEWAKNATDGLSKEKKSYVKLLKFLRDVICKKNNKNLIFRTWDVFHDRFHSNLDYYLDVTNQIEPHEKLVFSIKHTSYDFWRNMKFNPCLTQGKHQQIIEVQSQREYEGKGAFPNYAVYGVINGFTEVAEPKGLKDVIGHPLIKGIYNWSRGGGWYGPYIKNDLWPDLACYVLAKYVNEPNRTELEYFNDYCENILKLSLKDTEIFRKICLLSLDAILKGQYCAEYNKQLNGIKLPTNLWMRDDVLSGLIPHDNLGGAGHLKPVFENLYENDLFGEVIKEKEESVKIWKQIQNLYNQMTISDSKLDDYLRISIEYGLRLFTAISFGWQILAEGYCSEKNNQWNCAKLNNLIEKYDNAWTDYKKLPKMSEQCASLYRPVSWSWPSDPPPPGLDASINHFRRVVMKSQKAEN